MINYKYCAHILTGKQKSIRLATNLIYAPVTRNTLHKFNEQILVNGKCNSGTKGTNKCRVDINKKNFQI